MQNISSESDDYTIKVIIWQVPGGEGVYRLDHKTAVTDFRNYGNAVDALCGLQGFDSRYSLSELR